MHPFDPYQVVPLLSESKAPVYEPGVFLKPELIRVADTARIDSFVKIEGGQGVVLCNHVHIASFSYINVGGGLVLFEEGSGTAAGVIVIAGSNIPARGRSSSAAAPRDQIVIEHSFVFVRRNAMIFAGSTVLPGVTIGENSVIAAGSLVRHDVPAFEVWGGVPARKLGDVKEPQKPDLGAIDELFEMYGVAV